MSSTRTAAGLCSCLTSCPASSFARVCTATTAATRAPILLEVLKPSVTRVKPACSLFGVCGGCQYQHLEYSEQLSWKRQQVSDFLTRIGGLDPTLVNGVLQPTQGSPKQLNYRSKITPHWSVPKAVYDDDNDDYHAIGFLATTNRSKMVDVSACALATDKINAALPAARERLRRASSVAPSGERPVRARCCFAT